MGKVIIIGGGIAGIQTAITLSQLGHRALVLEKEAELGGKLRGWHKLFPSLTPAHEVLDAMLAQIDKCGAEVRTSAAVEKITASGVELVSGEKIEGDVVVVCSGFDVFDATLKEEYGYGLYNNVITSVELEKMFNVGEVKTTSGKIPNRLAVLHCVGSRDEKVCQKHCSRVCCITGVKQAMELKEMFPQSEIYNFYMDMRMFGAGYEEMYRQAQEQYNIHFVRGRISEASETIDGRIQIKAEDTLVGRPLKMSVDMLVLMVGMVAGESNDRFAQTNGVELYPSRFLKPKDQFVNNVCSGVANIFYAGTVTAPKNVGETLNEGVAVAQRVSEYLSSTK